MAEQYQFNPGPIGIGGVGGSGTRLVASLVDAMGVFMGEWVNESNDSVAWPPLRRLLSATPANQQAQREDIIFSAIAAFERQMHDDCARAARGDHNWFWKVPTTFFWLEPLAAYFPRLRYIHVIRHGLDMAFSGNRRQVKVWADAVGMRLAPPLDPIQMLEYWVRANELAVDRASALLGDRFLVLSFDALCANPATELSRLADFVDCPAAQRDLAGWQRQIATPTSVGRHRDHDCHELFGEELLTAVRRFGFSTPALSRREQPAQ